MFFSLLTIYSCYHRGFSAGKDYMVNEQLLIPKGSIFKFDKVNNRVDFTLPKGYALIGETVEGKLSGLYESGALTCDCTAPSGGGCSPFKAQGPKGIAMGCSVDKCNSCIGTIQGKGVTVDKVEVLHLDKINIVKTDDIINFVVDLKEFESLKNPTSEIMNSEFAIKTISEFIEGFQRDNMDLLAKTTDVNKLKDIGYILVPINFCGYRIYLPVDTSLGLLSANPLINQVISKYLDYDGVNGYSCVCNTKRAGCVLKSNNAIIGSVTWCEAGKCNSCTLISK